MDERSANVLKSSDSFADDALLSGGTTGEKLFVINLCAANVPQAIDTSSVQMWGIAGIERYKLYQVSRMEDGRRRYRVRLGFFTSEAAAELVLQSVRGRFATAFSSCLADEDLKHASGYLKKPLHEIQEIQDLQRTGRYRIPKIAFEQLAHARALLDDEPQSNATSTRIAATRSAVPHAAAIAPKNAAAPKQQAAREAAESVVEIEWSPASKVTPAKSAATPKAAHTAKQSAHKPSHPGSSAPPAAKVLSLGEHPAIPAQKPKVPSGPFHAASGRDIPDHGFSLTDDAPAFKPQAPAAAKVAPAAAKTPATLPRPLVSAEALAKLRAAAQPRNQAAVVPTLDSTQTIRTLTKKETEDQNAPKWYVVRLAVSDQPANLDTMPRLDIFEAYRLYSVATMDGAVIRHALRLGFFSEQVSAEAVLGYLKTFFADPQIERVSDAEQKRFAQPPSEKPTKTEFAARPQSQVITLEDKRGALAESAPAATAPAKPAPAKMPNRTVAKSAPQKRAPTTRKPTNRGKTNNYAHLTEEQRTAIEEARMLGLTETAIRRIEPNSLLSRLVDKLTK